MLVLNGAAAGAGKSCAGTCRRGAGRRATAAICLFLGDPRGHAVRGVGLAPRRGSASGQASGTQRDRARHVAHRPLEHTMIGQGHAAREHEQVQGARRPVDCSAGACRDYGDTDEVLN